MRITITIARQLGCGGSIVGQEIADRLNIRCIDREIVSRTAQQFEVEEEEVANREEKVSSFWERVLGGLIIPAPEAAFIPAPSLSPTDREIFASETEVMKSIAQTEDCVIVGRAGAHVLPSHPGMFNIYLHAPLSFRVPRVMEYYGINEGQALAKIKRSDETREKFITQVTGRDAADARHYHLCLDSSMLPLAEVADLVSRFVQRRVDTSSAPTVTI
jgi:cytidylate kinase